MTLRKRLESTSIAYMTQYTQENLREIILQKSQETAVVRMVTYEPKLSRSLIYIGNDNIQSELTQ